MSSKRTAESLANLISKSSVAVFALIYGVGFIVVSLYHENYGIVEANFFRARIIAAGLCAVGFIGIAAYLALYIEQVGSSRHNLLLAKVSLIFQRITLFYLVCAVVAGISRYLFTLNSDIESYPHPHLFLLLAVFLVVAEICSVVMAVSRRAFFQWVSFTLAISTTATIVVLVFLSWPRAGNFGLAQVTCSLFLLGGLAFGLIRSIRDPQERRKQNWIVQLVIHLVWISAFSKYIYPHIRYAWGGGSLVAVEIHLTASSALAPDRVLKGELVDESDQGFFLLGAGSRVVAFVPRSTVQWIEYRPGTIGKFGLDTSECRRGSALLDNGECVAKMR